MSTQADDIRADFLVEAGEIIDQLGESVAALEGAPSDRELLNAAFRGFHTIKGGAGFLGFTPVVALCHAVEDRLDMARNGSVPLDEGAVGATLEALDLLGDMLALVGRGDTPPAPPDGLLARLRDGIARQGEPSPGAAAGPSTATPATAAATGGDLDDLDFEALLDSLHGAGGAPGAAATASPDVPDPVAVAPGPVDPPGRAAAAAPAPHPPVPRPRPASGEPAEASVRVDVRRLDAIVNLVGELVLARNRLKSLRPRLRDDDLDRACAALDVATSRLQSAVMAARMQPVGRVFARFPKLAREVARQLDKQVRLELGGADTELDRNLVEALADPLVHLVRNAIDHGIEAPADRRRAGKPEQGTVRLEARQEGDHVAIAVRDDGGGIDPEGVRRKAVARGLLGSDAAARLSSEECLQLLFLPGFSTRDEVSDLSGRGVGMDVVQSRIRELSGEVQIQSVPGAGSTFVIRVPLTLAILPVLLVDIAEDIYALPLMRVVEVLGHDPATVVWIDGRAMLDLRRHPMPLLDLRRWLGIPGAPAQPASCVVLQSGEQRYGLVVDRVRGREEVVIKALPPVLRGLPGYAGASLVGDGHMALILDADSLLRGDSADGGSSPASGDR